MTNAGDGATRVLAIRHGETAWNVDSRIQGQLDIGLNPTGRWQAEQLARALHDDDLAAVYSSDLSRAYETARSVAERVGMSVQIDVGLRERNFGEFQGMTFKEIESRWPELSVRWRRRDADFAPPGGESLTAFYARCVGAAEGLAAAHPGQAIALVAHGGVLDCLYRAASRINLQAPRTWLVANASINRLFFSSQGFSLIAWADSGHLHDYGSTRDEISDGAVLVDLLGPAV